MLSVESFANQALKYNNEEKINLTPYIQLFLDETGELGPLDILNAEEKQWISEIDPIFGPIPGAAWYKLSIDTLDVRDPIHYINMRFSRYDSVKLFHFVDGALVDEQLMIGSKGFKYRPMQYPSPLFPIVLKDHSQNTVLLRIDSKVLIIFDVQLFNPAGNLEDSHNSTLIFAFLLGAFVLIFLYNTAIFLLIRDPSFIYFAISVLIFLIVFAHLDGHAYQYLWPNSHWFNLMASRIIGPIGNGFFSLFIIHYLKLKDFHPKLYRTCLTVAVANFALGLYPVITLQSEPGAIHILSGVSSTIITAFICFIAWGQGNRSAGYTLIGYLPEVLRNIFSIGGLLFGYYNFVMSYTSSITMIWLALFLTYALSARLKEIQEERYREKNEFMSRVSHELRTPLNGILGALYLLDNDEQHNDKNVIKGLSASAKRLYDLVENILLLSDENAKSLPKTTKLREFIQQTTEDTVRKCNEDSVDFVVSISPMIQDYLMIDQPRLRQVIQQLLSNSCKFTQHGYITLCITLIDESKDHEVIEFSIRDSGKGVAKKDRKKIFQSFTQVESFYRRQQEGLGIGLNLVVKTLRSLDSELEFDTNSTVGAHFKFKCQFSKSVEPIISQQDQVTQNRPHEDTQTTTKHKVLYVEDNKVNQLMLEKTLTKLGYDVEIAENGKEGVDKVQSGHFDIVLMDISMPIMDGYEATKKIRALGYKTLPILALTANSAEDDKQKCLSLGVNEYLSKPITAEELQTILDKYLAE